jgi:hypothetical protein
MRRLFHLVVSSLVLGGCFGPSEGVEVPLDQIYFPVGLALDSSQQHLVVVSSDFDLQYNGGAIQSYWLSAPGGSGTQGLEAVLPRRCVVADDCGGGVCESGLCVDAPGASPCPQGDRADADRLLYPARCNPIDPAPLQAATVKIGAFATDAVLRPRGDGGDRLFVPVRGDSTLHWLDLDGDDLECGQGRDNACDARHRVGDDPSETSRDIRLGPEPFAIDATEHGEKVVVTNQTTGTIALFGNEANGPQLKFNLSGNLPSRPVGLAGLPLTRQQTEAFQALRSQDPSAQAEPTYTFLVTFRDSAQVRLFRTADDEASTPERPYLVDGGGVGIDANSVGSDSRGVAIDASARRAAEAACAADDTACLAQAALVPVDVYVANRAPASLLIGRTRPPQEYPYFFQTLPLSAGPSRVVVGKVVGASGEEETRVFVVCFESRRVYVYDPQRARIETEIVTGRGPHALAVDTKRRLLYVGHFTDSYIGVFSLDLAYPETYGTMLGMLGSPKAPRSSK